MSKIASVFHEKFMEFADDLRAALPELTVAIDAAVKLAPEVRLSRFVEEVVPNSNVNREVGACPGIVLPGVVITPELWGVLSDNSKKAIQEYLTILSFSCLYDPTKSAEWTEDFLKNWRDRMESTDFEGLSKKIADLMSNLGPDAMPKIPERLLKGHLAKLAEDLVKEFKPEDFGLSAEELAACDKDPSRAFTLLTDIYTKKPEVLQRAIQRIAGRLQEKMRRGELRPEQIAAEAEELMKEFSENGAFVELMKSFSSTFGMTDPDLAREAGREGNARRELVRDRLRKKLEARKSGKK
jgi:hypothetical protein